MAESNNPKRPKYTFNKNIYGQELKDNISSDSKTELQNVEDPRTQTYKLIDLDFQQPVESKEKVIYNSEIHKGDTDSSDDEDNRNVFESKLNEYGKSIKNIINQKPEISNSNSSFPLPKYSFKSSKEEVNEEIFGIYIKNPVIPLKIIRSKIEEKKIVSFYEIKSFLSLEKSSDWIISGVIISKSPIKQSKNGDNFSIWKLSDLKGNLKTITLFLFRAAHNAHWKCSIGSVIAILNPSKFENRDKSDEATLFVDNSERLIILGESRDFGLCLSRNKNGNQCSNFVNKKSGSHCIYHLQQEYKNYAKNSNSKFFDNHLDNLKKKVLGKNEVFYGGRSFSALNQTRPIPAKDSKRLQNLSLSNKITVLPSINKPNSLTTNFNQSKVTKSNNERLQLLETSSKPHLNTNSLEEPKLNTNVPKLGTFKDMSIDVVIPSRNNGSSSAKLKALEWVKRNGPIKKSSEKKRKRDSSPTKIEKKINNTNINEKEKEEFILKFKKMLEKTSKNTELIDKKDAEAQENYFQKLEKKELLEEKMLSVFQMPCKAVKCLTCKYEAFSSADRCKEERHNIKVFDAIKRFFQCTVCGNRTVSLKIMPLTSCKRCMNSSWKKTSMIKENIQKLDIQLSIRGAEEKYIGGAVKNDNINLNVPDEA